LGGVIVIVSVLPSTAGKLIDVGAGPSARAVA
jgi:hypothetical protein